jgi:hypothetical protein
VKRGLAGDTPVAVGTAFSTRDRVATPTMRRVDTQHQVPPSLYLRSIPVENHALIDSNQTCVDPPVKKFFEKFYVVSAERVPSPFS